jgi:hypothetical protein
MSTRPSAFRWQSNSISKTGQKLIHIARQWIKLADEAAAEPDNRTIAEDHLALIQIPNPAATKSKAG